MRTILYSYTFFGMTVDATVVFAILVLLFFALAALVAWRVALAVRHRRTEKFSAVSEPMPAAVPSSAEEQSSVDRDEENVAAVAAPTPPATTPLMPRRQFADVPCVSEDTQATLSLVPISCEWASDDVLYMYTDIHIETV